MSWLDSVRLSFMAFGVLRALTSNGCSRSRKHARSEENTGRNRPSCFQEEAKIEEDKRGVRGVAWYRVPVMTMLNDLVDHYLYFWCSHAKPVSF